MMLSKKIGRILFVLYACVFLSSYAKSEDNVEIIESYQKGINYWWADVSDGVEFRNIKNEIIFYAGELYQPTNEFVIRRGNTSYLVVEERYGASYPSSTTYVVINPLSESVRRFLTNTCQGEGAIDEILENAFYLSCYYDEVGSMNNIRWPRANEELW